SQRLSTTTTSAPAARRYSSTRPPTRPSPQRMKCCCIRAPPSSVTQGQHKGAGGVVERDFGRRLFPLAPQVKRGASGSGFVGGGSVPRPAASGDDNSRVAYTAAARGGRLTE